MVTAYIGVGANVGDRYASIGNAMDLLAQVPGVRLVKTSGWLETDPVGPIQEQPRFVNGVAAIETDLPPLDLLDRLLAIEKQLGRVRAERWGPRTIDLDILFYGDQRIDHPRLKVPHPEIPNRSFWLEGLREAGCHCERPQGSAAIPSV